MGTKRKASARRGRAPLTRESVIRAAVELADRQGIAALSMRALAQALKVEAMSLYHHVPGKEALLDGMVDLVFSEIYAPRVGGEWRQELRARSLSGREVLARHPWAIGLMDSRSGAGMETLRHHDAVIGCLRSAGFSLPLIAHAFAVVDAHLYGFMIQELSLPFDSSEELEGLAESMLDQQALAALPHFAEFVQGHALQPGYSFGDEFEWGLDLVLDGLARRLAEETPLTPRH